MLCCAPCRERGNPDVPSTRRVAGTPMCEACFGDKDTQTQAYRGGFSNSYYKLGQFEVIGDNEWPEREEELARLAIFLRTAPVGTKVKVPFEVAPHAKRNASKVTAIVQSNVENACARHGVKIKTKSVSGINALFVMKTDMLPAREVGTPGPKPKAKPTPPIEMKRAK